MFLRDTLLAVLKDPGTPPGPEPEVARELAERIPARSPHALILTGVRRSGKSILQTQLRRRVRHAFSCNFEDTRLYGLGPEDFPALLSVIEELAVRNAQIFLDEVQEVPEWQRLVRSLLDRGRTVCVTGSNASLLGRELGAKLTGRHLSYEVFPFSYREYLAYTRARPGAASLQSWLEHGGFPGHLRRRDPQVLQELLRDVVYRDIALRRGLRETKHVMNLALFLLAHTGQPLSLQSLTKALEIPTVAQTSRYVEFLEDAYLLLSAPKFSPSFKKRVVAPRKYYAVDTGFRRANSPQMIPDLGRQLENAVFMALRRRQGRVCYAGEKDLWECDFVTDREIIQVTAELSPHNRKREVEGLLRASRLPGKRKALLLTLNQRDRLKVDGLTIDVRPAWDWLTASAGA